MNESKSLNASDFMSSDIRIAEMQRIRKAGGYIEYGRVNGKSLVLSLSTF